MELKTKILEFLYEQVGKNALPHIRKGTVEDFEEFILKILAEQEESKVANRMANTEPTKEE